MKTYYREFAGLFRIIGSRLMALRRQVVDDTAIDPGATRRRTVKVATWMVGQAEEIDQAEVKRLEITLLGNGDVLWRAYPADGSETYGGIETREDE